MTEAKTKVDLNNSLRLLWSVRFSPTISTKLAQWYYVSLEIRAWVNQQHCNLSIFWVSSGVRRVLNSFQQASHVNSISRQTFWKLPVLLCSVAKCNCRITSVLFEFIYKALEFIPVKLGLIAMRNYDYYFGPSFHIWNTAAHQFFQRVTFSNT